jgi:hypothetical protein
MVATTLEFETHPNEDGTLPIPPAIVAQLKGVPSVRVLLILQSSSAEEEWASLTREQFLKGSADGDAIYDQLSSSSTVSWGAFSQRTETRFRP